MTSSKTSSGKMRSRVISRGVGLRPWVSSGRLKRLGLSQQEPNPTRDVIEFGIRRCAERLSNRRCLRRSGKKKTATGTFSSSSSWGYVGKAVAASHTSMRLNFSSATVGPARVRAHAIGLVDGDFFSSHEGLRSRGAAKSSNGSHCSQGSRPGSADWKRENRSARPSPLTNGR